MSYATLPLTPLDIALNDFKVTDEFKNIPDGVKFIRNETNRLYNTEDLNLFTFLFKSLKYDSEHSTLVTVDKTEQECESAQTQYRYALLKDLQVNGLPEKIFSPQIKINIRGTEYGIDLEVLKSTDLLKYPYFQRSDDIISTVVMYPGIKLSDLALQLPAWDKQQVRLVEVRGRIGIKLINSYTNAMKLYITTLNDISQFFMKLDFKQVSFDAVWSEVYGVNRRVRTSPRVKLN